MDGNGGGANSIADWVDALGSAGAAVLAVSLYAADKIYTRRREWERREAARLAHALRTNVYLDPVLRQLYYLISFVNPERFTSAPVSMLLLPNPDELIGKLGEPAAFTGRELDALAQAAIAIANINAQIIRNVERSGDSEFVRSSSLDWASIQECVDICSECHRKMDAVLQTVEHYIPPKK